jgi:MarR family transcriptional regulator, transcriptional regulator for hemolysin
MKRLNPRDSLGFHCNLTVKAFMRALEKRLKGTGVSNAQFLALEQIISAGSLSVSELVDRLCITPATGVRLVDRMERDGWVTRQPSSNDGRVKRLVVTKSITKLWSEVAKSGEEILVQAYRGIRPEEIETVKRVLDAVQNNLAGC